MARRSSWGHALRALTPQQQALRVTHRWRCVGAGGVKCEQTPTHVSSYGYTHHRTGRPVHVEREQCADHAESFAQRYNLHLPATPVAETGGAP